MGIYGSSRVMGAVLELARMAAATRSSVLICGERGTGREMVARTIHALSGCQDTTFVKIDCARLNVDVEFELFGSRAPLRREGAGERLPLERVSRLSLLRRAAAGTMFLEHLSELPMRVQARLVRVLRDDEAALSDTSEIVELNTRVVVAVPPEFETWVQEGSLRNDLFQRVSAIRIELPPLRQRREDVLALAWYFLESICCARGMPMKALSEPAAALLCALPWPGNAPELSSLVQRLAMTVPRPTIELDDVLANIKLDASTSLLASGGTLREARARFEREYIAAVLDQHNGRMVEAARALGIQRTHLYRKVKSLQLDRPSSNGHSRGRQPRSGVFGKRHPG